MKITQLRNATIVLELGSEGRSMTVLVDPMLADEGTLPSLKYFGAPRRRNPIVPLPVEANEVLGRVTHALITHCQRGHFDHLDHAGKRFLRDRKIPVVCTAHDTAYLATRGLLVSPLSEAGRQPFFHGHITPIPCVHGDGIVGRLMEHGSGYLIELPDEPSVYVAGDTLLTDDVARCLRELRPDVAILPAGGARLDLGGEIIMNGDDVVRACALTNGIVVANHLEALDHCPTTRDGLRDAANRAGVGARLRIPGDGETIELTNPRTP